MGYGHADVFFFVGCLTNGCACRLRRRRRRAAADRAGTHRGMPTATVVGMTGGAVTSSDGKLALSIPAGAVGSNVTITTEPATPPAAGAVGTVYEIGPTERSSRCR